MVDLNDAEINALAKVAAPPCTGNGTVYEWSGPEDAPVVVLIHGLGLNRHTWQWHEAALSARYRVLNYDLFGHGESAPPPAPPTLALFSTQLCDLLDALNIERCTMVGFSLGGMINRRFALDHGDRLNALAILNSPHERSPKAQKEVEDRAAQTAQGGPAATLDATIERWFTPEFRTARPEIMALIRGWVMANDPVIYTQCRQVLARGVVELIRPAPPIVHPTLVMTAEDDSGSTPAMAHAIASEMPDAQTIIVPKLQHMALVEAPSQFTEPLLRFCDEKLSR
ncbi:alpha/beta fold hydrolase [Candidatus Entotheonella palauensis]|uniref:3-oxoadipate enol-lactonase n=1 Tax=Candidatus Entotheonella gemina TaxID=1429439 RepID=W4M879_9BACT|nr:alpha/beta fold hydrolase [Candidatus Entotheonella palauensis]ETX06574.1 MAG: 3-oxoadipate enol-lactonase [Candidatus Entotheonella gemina]